MRIEYVHASRYGNGAAVAEEFRRLMAARGAYHGMVQRQMEASAGGDILTEAAVAT